MDNELSCWTVDFYNFHQVFTMQAEDGQLVEFGDVHAWAERNGVWHGTPILLSPTGEADPRINLFFRFGSVAAKRPRTWRRYAFSLAAWLDFLQTRGRSSDEATACDFDDFKHWRMTDSRNRQRVRPTSFDTDRAGLNTFYDWAATRYGIVNPIPTHTVAGDHIDDAAAYRNVRCWQALNAFCSPGLRPRRRPAKPFEPRFRHACTHLDTECGATANPCAGSAWGIPA
ncbi:hypothetical protein [Saccharopolyspora pogona]|uniref:hypothetical protein n=1 Tax=Saccharopolyspora pogona TaxID=333966 RepID=UPI001688BC8E|nr:hypothetical protein [Saccharopolyspora pogona]